MENRIQEEFKPRTWLLVILVILAILIAGFLLYNGVDAIKKNIEKEQKERQKERDKWDNKQDEFDKEYDDIKNKIATSSFNGSLKLYSGSEYGDQVENLFDEVIESNTKNKDRQISITFKGQTSSDSDKIRDYKKGLDSWTKYEVIMNYDDDGYINKIEVK